MTKQLPPTKILLNNTLNARLLAYFTEILKLKFIKNEIWIHSILNLNLRFCSTYTYETTKPVLRKPYLWSVEWAGIIQDVHGTTV